MCFNNLFLLRMMLYENIAANFMLRYTLVDKNRK